MVSGQNGVLAKSKMFFYPPVQNSGLFFCPVSVGHFFCDSRYRVERKFFDSILITYIVEGTFNFPVDGEEYAAHSGEVALVDCFHPHIYYTTDGFEAYWLHIKGSNVYALYKELVGRFSGVITADQQVEMRIKAIYSDIKTARPVSDSDMSLAIYGLFMELYAQSGIRENTDAVNDAIRFIIENYHQTITVEDVARSAHLSASQFSRKFKKQTGASPYEYILNVRLAKAKEMLKNTSLPVSEIAYRTGFQSDSNFIYFFKRKEGVSPTRFRKILF